MNRALRVQGRLFLALVVLSVIAGTLLPRVSPKAEIVAVTLLILVLGVPHGALDTVFARKRYSLRTWRTWLRFGLLYAGCVAFVVAVWYLVPVVFLVVFLGLSALHFSGDPLGGTSRISRLVQGGAVLVLPALRHQAELTELFGMLVGPSSAGFVVPWLTAAAVPWACGVIVGAVVAAAASKQSGLELLAVGVLAITAPPLLAFAVYFCGMHAARHILRTATYAGITSWRQLATSSFVPMLLVGCTGLAVWEFFGEVRLEVKVIQLLFVGLASLTVPHMLLVEPVRLAGWADGRP